MRCGAFSLEVGVATDAQEPILQESDKVAGDLFKIQAPTISLAVYSKTCITDGSNVTECLKITHIDCP